jgi:hypothetical protein
LPPRKEFLLFCGLSQPQRDQYVREARTVLSLQGDRGLCGDSDNDDDPTSSSKGSSTGEGAGNDRAGQEVKLDSTSGHKKRIKVDHCQGQGEGGGSGQADGRGRSTWAVDSKKRIEAEKEGGGAGTGKGKRGVLPNIMQLRQICDFADFDDLPSDDRDGGSDRDKDRDVERYGGGGKDKQDNLAAIVGALGGDGNRNGNGNHGVPMGEYVDTLLRHSTKMKVSGG